MSIWTSNARCAALLALTLPLAACLAPGQGGGRLNLLEAPNGRPAEMLRRVSFFHGEVIVAGPDGYCIDPKSVRRRGGNSFALLANCAHLSKTESSDAPAAVITVSVLAHSDTARQPSAAEMAAALTQSGVMAQIDGDGMTLVQVARGGDRKLPGSDPRHWRATLLINGHLVGLAVYSGPNGAATGRAGHDIMIATAKAMRQASPVKRPKDTPPIQTLSQKMLGTGKPALQ
ncbi:hypothetical protein OO012_09965 [Rhodobacteraceae bacterium KMM 6894]|nr:hypothetical protein [Rhodobacteraceae bacterium KMM 6894]